MKTIVTSNLRPLLRALYAFHIAIAVLWAMPRNAQAQLYVLQNNPGKIGTVSEYSTTGAVINANFITGLSVPSGLALLGNTLFVTNSGSGTVGKYDATTGGAINAGFITGLNGPTGIAVSNNSLFVTYYSYQQGFTVGKYDATTGAAINANFIRGPTGTFILAARRNTLFGLVDGQGVVEYVATTGFPYLIMGPKYPSGLAVLGNNIFVAEYTRGAVGEYDRTTGAVINRNFITGLTEPLALAVKIAK
jgi:hypothetical protein